VPDRPKSPHVPEADFFASQVLENTRLLEPQSAPPKSFRYRLQWHRVNEVTYKLTDGELTNVPRSHGQWGGYRTAKAVAWVICIFPARWLARYRDMVSGPMSLPKAKAAAMAMAKGAVGDYFVPNPIEHLNGLTARLTDSEAETPPDGCDHE
jgi:hypothetical protein